MNYTWNGYIPSGLQGSYINCFLKQSNPEELESTTLCEEDCWLTFTDNQLLIHDMYSRIGLHQLGDSCIKYLANCDFSSYLPVSIICLQTNYYWTQLLLGQYR